MRTPLLIAVVALAWPLVLLSAEQEARIGLAGFTRSWHDGKAEIALYDAARTIYGRPRSYVARLITNRETASPETFTKSATSEGRAVFKFHTREDIPTENYTY